MERFLLDTSIILDILEDNPDGATAVELLKEAEATTSIICFCEVMNKTNGEHAAKAREFLSKLLVFEVTLADGRKACEFQAQCRQAGKHVPTMDCLIAATACNHDGTVLTTDSDFNRIDGVSKRVLG